MRLNSGILESMIRRCCYDAVLCRLQHFVSWPRFMIILTCIQVSKSKKGDYTLSYMSTSLVFDQKYFTKQLVKCTDCELRC